MMKKGILLLLPVLTLFSPMLLFKAPQWWSELRANFSTSAPGQTSSPDAGLAAGAVKRPQDPTAKAPSIALDGTPIHELGEVLRFDVSPGWVVAQWPRVSAGLAQLQLQGYRVPLVTGTDVDDLAGSLTYYFNPRQEVQRLTFHGTTGDTRSLVALLTARYGFRRRLTNDPGVFLYEVLDRSGKPTSFLWIRLAPVVKANEPLDRYEVALLLERPEAA
jgi:hypothetical protein